jgi:hypothetical protein
VLARGLGDRLDVLGGLEAYLLAEVGRVLEGLGERLFLGEVA